MGIDFMKGSVFFSFHKDMVPFFFYNASNLHSSIQ